MRIRLADDDDSAAIASIYAPYVEGSPVSFETEAPDQAEMRRRIEAGAGLYPWLVADEGGAIAGYAYATAFRPRAAYRFCVETTVYLAQGRTGQGLGSSLYRLLIETLEAQGFAQAIGAITLPNPSSVRLHEALGFSPAGAYRQVGYKLGRWYDVGLWQRALAAASDPPAEPKPVGAVIRRIIPG